MKNKLWAETVKCANMIESMTFTRTHSVPLYTLFTGITSRLYDYLIEFGRYGYVTLPTRQRNFENKSERMIMAGYSEKCPAGTYCFYNPRTNSIIESRNVTWAEWQAPPPTQHKAPLTHIEEITIEDDLNELCDPFRMILHSSMLKPSYHL